MAQQPQGISNLNISSEVIGLSPETQSGQLTIFNTHKSFALLFKIKTKIEKVFQVKPTKGFLLPGDKAVITFKALNKIGEEDRVRYEKDLQFLLQAVNRNSHQITREEEENQWKQIKEKKADLSLGYCSVKIGINFSGEVQAKPFSPAYASYESRVDNRFSSNLKSEGKSSISLAAASSKNEEDLSSKYEILKSQYGQLQRERENLFSVNKRSGKTKGGPKIPVLIIIFVFFFILGNYLQTLLEPAPEPKQPEKHWFFGLFQ